MLDCGHEPKRRRSDHRAECFGKTSYNSKGAAIERIKWQNKTHRMKHRNSGWAGTVVLVPYRCPHCHHWHVGGTDKLDLRGARRRKYYD